MATKREMLDQVQLHDALQSVNSHLKHEKGNLGLEIIQSQLQWLQDYASGKTFTGSKLKDIALGQLAMREVETLDMELAEKLYEIQSVVNEIK
ncbi:immunity protein Tsi6 family protein [Rheinheimera faecalis]|uniref:immunity protein Tsi6 family protein n=1 Tax=Rheinheimera faecalis TaxID=2901141 RepID=UPI001E3112B5|nr:immunity protein Tsi6 family protein [Rheinheimera faecalis]